MKPIRVTHDRVTYGLYPDGVFTIAEYPITGSESVSKVTIIDQQDRHPSSFKRIVKDETIYIQFHFDDDMVSDLFSARSLFNAKWEETVKITTSLKQEQ